MGATFTFILATSLAGSIVSTATVPGLSEAECNRMTQSAPAAVAQHGREAGRQLELVEARCEREEG
jgi:hypothetical protein